MGSRVGSAVANTSSLTPAWSGAGAGEIELAWAYRSGSATPPSVPSGWTTLLSAGGNTTGGVFAYRFCPTNSNVASGTFTNATQLIIARYKGIKGIGNIIGSNATGTSISFPGLTAVQTAGNSIYVAGVGHRTATNCNVAPTGMTNFAGIGSGANITAAMHDTNGGVSGWTTQSVTVNASSGHESMVLELLADGGAFSIYNSAGSSAFTLSTENKVAVSTTNPANTNCIRFFTSHSTGKWIFGLRLFQFGGGSDSLVGLCTATASMAVWPGGANNNGVGYGFNSGGNDSWVNHTATNNGPNLGTTWALNDFGNVAVDLDAGKIWIQTTSMGGDWNGDPTASPDAGTGAFTYTDLIGTELFPFYGTGNNGGQFAMNTFDFDRIDTDAASFQPWDNPSTTISGTASIADAADTLAATGALKLKASLAVTDGADTLAATGNLKLKGSAAIADGADTLSAHGGINPISGSLSVTDGADTLAGAGALKIKASLAVTDGADTLAGVSRLVMRGSLALTDGADTLAGSGKVKITGQLVLTDAADITIGMGNLIIGGQGGGLDAADVLTATGKVKIKGSVALTDDADTLTAIGSSIQTGSGQAHITDGADILTATGKLAGKGSADITDGADTLAAAGNLRIVSSSGIVDPIETIAASGKTKIKAAAAIADGADQLVASGQLKLKGSLALTDGADQLAATGRIGSLEFDPRFAIVAGRRLTAVNSNRRQTFVLAG